MNNKSNLSILPIILSDLFNQQPVQERRNLEIHLHAVVSWLLHAQRVNSDGGIAACYKMIQGNWALSYPETTGYTIPTLLEYANQFERPDIVATAIRMAEYELSVQSSDGGFPCIQDRTGKSWPVAFDTGQVLFGLFAAYDITSDSRYMESAIRAGNWLVVQQSEDGYWIDYHSQGCLRAIDARVSWPLLMLFERTRENSYKNAAQKQLEWTLKQQMTNGWFQNCSFRHDSPPITHTIAYTVEGLLESALLLGEERYLLAAKKTADIFLDLQNSSGFLAGAFNYEWKPIVYWSCLTGCAQIARIWLRLGEITGSRYYYHAAEKIIRFISATQRLYNVPKGIYGGIAGSWPVYGGYMRLKYPNWAANFFMDAILKLLRVQD